MRFMLRNLGALAGLVLSISGLAVLGDFPRGAFDAAGWQFGSVMLCVGLVLQLLIKLRQDKPWRRH